MIALRNLFKNRLYSAINIVGLAVGLTIYVFGSLLVDYEEGHDQHFTNYDRIYTLNSYFSSNATTGFGAIETVYAGFAPVLDANSENIEHYARTMRREFLVSIDDADYYQLMRFTDPALTQIFDFDYIAGDATALEQPNGVLLTRTAAERFFGGVDVVGETITLDHQHDVTVAAVIEDLPADTHFTSSIVQSLPFEVIAPYSVLEALNGYDPDQDWGDLSLGNLVYLLLKEDANLSDVQVDVNDVYNGHFPEDTKDFVTRIQVTPLAKANTFFWEMTGLPVINSVSILAALVLVVSCVNYANLATAQNMGRAREVGLRRTMGAKKTQLLVQFLLESLCVATVAMFMALVILEILIPTFNALSGKVLDVDHLSNFIWLASTTIVVGIVSGGYPAYLITRATPMTALRDETGSGSRGALVRSIMIGLQFGIAIFMLAVVMVMFFQNQKISQTRQLFPTDQTVILERMFVDEIREKHETLKNELLALPGVVSFSYASQVPFEQSNRTSDVSNIAGDKDSSFRINRNQVDEDFLATLDIQLVAGRNISKDITGDTSRRDVREINVMVNELATRRLGYANPDDAVGNSFYSVPSEGTGFQYNIVGVVEDQNFLGFHNQVKPFVFHYSTNYRNAVLRIRPTDVDGTLNDIRRVWGEIVPEYPIQIGFLSETFEDVYKIFRAINVSLAAFAVLAMTLALFGLFGLAAFMAEQRTKEIGVRRVLGASVLQVIRLLIWKFSKPVVYALLLALPSAYFIVGLYLQLFSDRIDLPIAAIALAGLVGVFLSWAIVAGHAAKVARANPINALRYE
jgi:putative ABC transport system permease protein